MTEVMKQTSKFQIRYKLSICFYQGDITEIALLICNETGVKVLTLMLMVANFANAK